MLPEITAPKEWYALLDILEKEKGLAIILGASDTGKSTLAKFLIFNLCERGLKVALADADIGQSFLGPPTTIGLSLFKSDPDWKLLLSPPEIFFVGSTTAEGCIPIHLKGVKRMVDKAIAYGPDFTILDTTGFVLGEGGRELKRRKIDLVSPRFILALQRSEELEPILGHYEESPLLRVFRLPLSEKVRSRSIEDRKRYRDDRFQEYFRDSAVQELAVEAAAIEGEVHDPNGDTLPSDWVLRINGLLIGLKDGNDETLALGVIRNYVDEKKVVRILTPLVETEKVKTIQLSSLRVIPIYEDSKA